VVHLLVECQQRSHLAPGETMRAQHAADVRHTLQEATQSGDSNTTSAAYTVSGDWALAVIGEE
jgi:hypothetical protein